MNFKECVVYSIALQICERLHCGDGVMPNADNSS